MSLSTLEEKGGHNAPNWRWGLCGEGGGLRFLRAHIEENRTGSVELRRSPAAFPKHEKNSSLPQNSTHYQGQFTAWTRPV